MEQNSVSFNAVSKQSPLISEKTQTANLNKNQLQNSTSSPGNCELQSIGGAQLKRKPLRLYQNRNRNSANNTQTGSPSITPVGVNVISPLDIRTQNTNLPNVGSTLSFRNKANSPLGQNVTQTFTQQVRTALNTTPARPIAPSPMPKSSLRLQQLDMEHSNELVKQAKLRHTPSQRQSQNDHRSQSGNAQRQLSNVSQHSAQTGVNTTPRRQQIAANTGQKRQQLIPSTPQSLQLQKTPGTPEKKHQYQESLVTPTPHDKYTPMDIESPEHIGQGRGQNQHNAPTDAEIDTANESVAYLQKIVDNPANTVVQQQIQGNTAKMLVILPNGEQRLITFDIPSEDCTVQDLLEQANITFCGETSVSLVSDPALGINYIVEAGAGTSMATPDANESDGISAQETTNSSSPDENCNPTQQNETFYKKNNERNSTGKLEKLDRDGSLYRRGRGRGRGAATRSKPIPKEPECLTISSDEEEEGKCRRTDGSNNGSVMNNTNNSLSQEMETILEKEPVITNNTVSSTSSDYASENEEPTKGDKSPQAPYTSLQCRTVRIGSYKYVPRERVVISQKGVRFGVPLLEDDKQFVALNVKFNHIVKVLIHFGKAMPVLFFYTSINAGAMIREVLGMQDPKGPYYDPAGKDHTHKRITLLPEKLTEEAKGVLKNLFMPELLIELNPKEANDILVAASPVDSLQVQSLAKRQNQASSSSSNASVNGGIQTITVYPQPPAKGGIAINTEDYLCLGEDQFLNDVIIDFYLKYLTLEVLSQTDQQRTHVFSSYFYKRLTSPHAQAAESNVPLSPAAKRHARVQKWTKNVNIFEKDFIVIPINEHAHWFLAIICFPGLVGKVSTTPRPVKEEDLQKTVRKSKKLKEVKLQAVTIGNTTITPVTTTITIDQADDGSERDEAEGDDEEMETDSDDEDEADTSEEKKSQQLKSEPKLVQDKDIVKLPCILIFDSLAGASRSRVVATLRDYLSCEHIAKLGSEKIFSKDTIKGACPKVPQQSNFTDCGVYVLQYVESFFKDPIQNYTLPIKTLKNWFEEIVVTRKREELSDLLIKLMNTTKGDKDIKLPTANFPTQDGKLKLKAEKDVDMNPVKSEAEVKKKPTVDGVHRVSNSVPTQMENAESINELGSKATYPIIPYSPSTSSNSSENNTTEMLTEPTKTSQTRTSTETMNYLKMKRIPRLMLRTENQEDSQAPKKHKGESFDSCK